MPSSLLVFAAPALGAAMAPFSMSSRPAPTQEAARITLGIGSIGYSTNSTMPDSFFNSTMNSTLLIRFDRPVGSGQGGSVFEAHSEETVMPLVVKFNSVESEAARQVGGRVMRAVDLKKEIASWSYLMSEPNVLPLLGLVGADGQVIKSPDGRSFRLPGMLMPKIEGVMLKAKIKELAAGSVVYQIDCFFNKAFDIVSSIWARGLRHGDCHIGNFMVLRKPSTDSMSNQTVTDDMSGLAASSSSDSCDELTVIDFGWSAVLSPSLGAIGKVADAKILCQSFENNLGRYRLAVPPLAGFISLLKSNISPHREMWNLDSQGKQHLCGIRKGIDASKGFYCLPQLAAFIDRYVTCL